MSDSHTHATFLAPEISRLEPLFPGYEIESLIATGGMGAVYCAVQKSLDRTVAIKILPDEFSKDASFCAGFEAEAKAMARLNHPNLIGVYDFGEVEGMLYIIMEYVPGKSLFHSAHGIAIDPGEVICLVTGICNGLAHAHENGIVHRDIKPSNILLDLNAQPKIGDFGLARPVERKDNEGDEIFGTPHYTAPEVVNSPESVGFRADIFSVGVVLHELLSGFLPADDPRPVSVSRGCDPRFDEIIRRATNPNPELRYANAAEISRDLYAISVSPAPRVPVATQSISTARYGQSIRPAVRPMVRPQARPQVRPRYTQSSSSGSSTIVWLLLAVVIGILVYVLFFNSDKTIVPVKVLPPKEAPPLPEKIPDIPASTPHKPEPRPEFRPESHPEPNQEPKSTPKIEFKLEPKPDPEVNIELKPETKPESKPQGTTPPTFDVNGFFENVKKIMQSRVKMVVDTRDKSFAKNVGALRRGMRRLILKIPQASEQRLADKELDRLIERCEQNGNRIPGKMIEKFHKMKVVEVDEIYDEFLGKQRDIDSNMLADVTKLADVYMAELKKQIARLKLVKDQSSIELIEAEISRVSQDGQYFPKLMLGEDFAQPKSKDEKP
ncbi:MAG: protein kinase [Verrucomicrobiota bacterium]